MNKKALSLAIFLALAIPTASNALSLGEIESKSSLNQSFQGRINLLQTNPAEVQNLRIKVASADVFNRVGLDRPAFLNSILFRTSVQNGKPVILVSSNQTINEPFLNFLLEVSWPEGQLLKEYTVLLDPPVLLRPNTVIASNNAGIRAEPKVQGRINRAPQPTPQQLQAQRQAQRQTQFQRQAQLALQNQQARRVAPAQSRSSSNRYRVRSGDTLSKIANKFPINGVRKEQMMVAMFEKNRRAFSKSNMNNLKAGALMVRPSLQEARGLTARAAKSQIIAQARAWKAKRADQLASRGADNTKAKVATTVTDNTNSARLEVLGKSDAATANNSTSGGNDAAVAGLNQQLALLTESLTTKQQENTEMKSRVYELESLLRKKNRLIALKSEQLASLQASIGGNQPEPQFQTDPNSSTPETVGEGIQNELIADQASDNGEIVRATSETAVVDNSPVPETIIPEVEPEIAQQEKPASAFKPESEAGLDIMGLVTSPLGLAAGAGSLGLLGLLALMRRRKNKGGEEIEDFSDLIDNSLNDQDIEEEMVEDDGSLEPRFNETEYVVHDGDDSSKEASYAVEDDDELDDLIQEADVYIVYGLHDQAESEIKRALNSYPNSAALHAKLLENYKAAGDAEAFEDATKTFIDLDADSKQNHWDKICEWGNALLPDSKLYDNSTLPDITAVATGAVMVAGTAIAASTDGTEELFEDISDEATDLFSNDIDANDLIDDDLLEDNILDEFDEVDITKDIEDFDDFDGFELGDSLDLDNVLDASDVEDSDELIDISDISDLSDDFELDLSDDFGSITDVIDFEDDAELTVEDEGILEVSVEDNADDVIDNGIENIVEDDIEDMDFLFDDESLEDLLNADENKANEDLPVASQQDEVGNINEAANLSLELGADGFDKIVPENHAYKSSSEELDVDFDLDENAQEDDNLLTDFDDNLSFLDLDDDAEVIGETQIETKIDLARAYIDMGDIEGARSTLEEVMEAGNDDQKREAEELLHQNG